MYCHATALMCGMVYAWHHDRHVRVDVLYQHYSANKKQRVNFLGTVLLAVPMLVFMVIACWQYVMDSWLRLEGSGETGGLPLLFVLKSLLLLMPLSILGYVVVAGWKQRRRKQSPEVTH